MLKFRKESGYTLIGVLLIFTIVSILGISLVSLSIASVKTSTTEHDNQSVYYVAEAGLNHMLNKIEEELKEAEDRILFEFSILDDDVDSVKDDYLEIINNELIRLDNLLLNDKEFRKDYKEFEQIQQVQPKAEFEIIDTENENEYKLFSTGYILPQFRKIKSTFQIGWDFDLRQDADLPPFAVFTSGQFTMSNGTIVGDIGTVDEGEGIISFPQGGPSLDGDIYVPDGDESIVNNQVSNINSEIKKIPDEYTIPELPAFPKIPSNFIKLPDEKVKKESSTTDLIKENNLYVVNWITNNYIFEVEENLEFNSINLDNNNTLYVDVGHFDKEIVVNKLNMKNGHIKLKGTGNLTIYVRDEIIMGAGSYLNEKSKLNKVNIFYAGNNDINLAGDQKIFGSLYAKQANMNLTGSGGIYGNIFTGGNTIKMSGGSDIEAQLILAPKANVEVLAGGHIEGKVIANSFTMDGGGEVILKEPFVLDGPISPSALESESGGETGSGGDESKLSNASLNISVESIRESDK